jgi:hypothetical protein
VYPAWVAYAWEGSGYDCSLAGSVSATLPAPLLFDRDGLRWRPGTRTWTNARGQIVAEHHEHDRHSALAVRESWLRATLGSGGWALVIGSLGEKQLIGTGWRTEVVGGWTEINGLAGFGAEDWNVISETATVESGERSDDV